MDVYEKINKAVIVCSAVQTIRGISPHPRANPASNSSPPIPGKTTDIHCKPDSSEHPKSVEGTRLETPKKREAVDAVAINFDFSSQPRATEKPKSATPAESSRKNTQAAKVASKMEPKVSKANPMGGSPEFSIQEGKKMEMHIEDSFTEYINRVKIMMRKTTSNVGDMPMPNIFNVSNVSDGKNASGKNEFSEYIDRAGIKIRTTSSIGDGNSRMF